MHKAKSFDKFILEGEADIAKPLASDEKSPESSDDKTTKAFLEIEDRISTCISSLESLYDHIKDTNIPKDKIDTIVSDLKGYLQNINDETDISNKSNQVKED